VIVVVPADTPVSTPEVETAKLPTPGLLLLQVPLAGVELSVVFNPTHTFSEPVITVGLGLMVNTAEARQPVESVFVIVEVVPPLMPRAIPVDDPMLALPLLVVHVPPPGVVFNVVVNPTHTSSVPVIGVGLGLIVTTAVLIHVVGSV